MPIKSIRETNWFLHHLLQIAKNMKKQRDSFHSTSTQSTRIVLYYVGLIIPGCFRRNWLKNEWTEHQVLILMYVNRIDLRGTVKLYEAFILH